MTAQHSLDTLAGMRILCRSLLCSRPLLAFAIEFERESDVSLAINASVLRVLDEKGWRVRDLPLLTGISKEAIQMALGYLGKKRMVVIEANPSARRAKMVRPTAKGRESMERLVGNGGPESPLFRGLEPYPDGWRASVPKPTTLPRYPMVLHDGGFPDGS